MFLCTSSIKGVEVRKVTYDNGIAKIHDSIQLIPNCRSFQFAPKFNYVALFTKSALRSEEFSDKFVQICTYNVEQGTITTIQKVDVPNIVRVQFSPNGGFFAVILRRNSVTDAQKIPLVQIYKTGGPLVRTFDYAHSGDNVTLYWSDDEKLFAYADSNGVNFFETQAGAEEKKSRLELPNLKCCAFGGAHGVTRCAVVYDREPKRMKIFEYPKLDKHLASRPCMVGEEFSVKMSPNGASAIAIGIKNGTDATYFGESFAYYLNTQGQQKLPLKKAGPIHTVEYSPIGDKFITIAGHVPPAAAVHFDKIGTCFDFGEMSMNSARWSCAANMVAFGGFGSFNGDIKIIDTQARKVISEGEAPYTSDWSWSPCGRVLMTAVLYPKMMVSNEVRLFNHMCGPIGSFKMEEMTQCEWVGLPKPLPLPKVSAPVITKAAVGSYVPPHLRGKTGPTLPPGAAPKLPPGFGHK